MSPTTTNTESSALANGSAGPDFRYVVSLPDSPQPATELKSQCSSLSDSENYECFPENGNVEEDSGIGIDVNGT